MKKATWFSRHEPTAAQIADAAKRGYEITDIPAGIAAGSVNMVNETDIWPAMAYCKDKVVFGVFPVPLRWSWYEVPGDRPAEAWEAWNTTRAVEGGKPTFEHRQWCHVM